MRTINFNLFPTLKAENISQPEKYLWLATKIKIDSLSGRSSKNSGLGGRHRTQSLFRNQDTIQLEARPLGS